MPTIDLNADVGEGLGDDARLIPLVTSVNIACGAHAGDASTMANAVQAALAAGVTIGAHPGHEDREHFGRREIEITPADANRLVARQISTLRAIAHPLGGKIRYVKLHGALYHQVGREPELAEAIVRTVIEQPESLALLGQPDTALEAAAKQAQIPFYREVFADRAYLADGMLAPRSTEGALLLSNKAVVQQSLGLATQGSVRTLDGESVAIPCDSLCLHGDGPQAAERAQALRQAFAEAGVRLSAFVSS